jgi:hypothetical protein
MPPVTCSKSGRSVCEHLLKTHVRACKHALRDTLKYGKCSMIADTQVLGLSSHPQDLPFNTPKPSIWREGEGYQ